MVRKCDGCHGKQKGPEGDPGTGYNKGELITTRSLSGPRKGYPEESTKNVMGDTDKPLAVSCGGKSVSQEPSPTTRGSNQDMANDAGETVMAVTRGKKGPETVEEVGFFLGVKTKNYPSQAPRKRYPEKGFKT